MDKHTNGEKNSMVLKERTILCQKENPESDVRFSITLSVSTHDEFSQLRQSGSIHIGRLSSGSTHDLDTALNRPLDSHSRCQIEKKVLEVLVKNNPSNQNITMWNQPTFCRLIGHSLATTSFFRHSRR